MLAGWMHEQAIGPDLTPARASRMNAAHPVPPGRAGNAPGYPARAPFCIFLDSYIAIEEY